MKNLTDSRFWECCQLILSWADEADKEAATTLEFPGPGVAAAETPTSRTDQQNDSNAARSVEQNLLPEPTLRTEE